ncbi:MAG: class I SAM-dependent methyltransferase, partial [Rhodothermales bacterium]|nr:class I SAM-dependent methyltransferase [Rhodothermales bacterium]
MAWYEQWFDRDEYELVYRERDESEAEQVVDLIQDRVALPAGARILDVGCGRGRHAVEFAARGFDVTGLDLSERSLSIAESRARDRGVELRLIHGDMRAPVDTDAFDLVVNLFTAFGYFERTAEHQRAVDAMATALKTGGMLVQDFLNAPYVRNTLVDRDARAVDGAEIVQERWISDDRINKEITLR